MKKSIFICLLFSGAFFASSQVNAQNGTKNNTSTTKEVKTEANTTKEISKCPHANAANTNTSSCSHATSAKANHTTAKTEQPKACCQKGQAGCDKMKENK